jgi:hypothetical protein
LQEEETCKPFFFCLAVADFPNNSSICGTDRAESFSKKAKLGYICLTCYDIDDNMGKLGNLGGGSA